MPIVQEARAAFGLQVDGEGLQRDEDRLLGRRCLDGLGGGRAHEAGNEGVGGRAGGGDADDEHERDQKLRGAAWGRRGRDGGSCDWRGRSHGEAG
jgi:hypothetical protein